MNALGTIDLVVCFEMVRGGLASKASIEEIDASRRNDFSPAFQGRVSDR
jgi:hypothetical protein